jgi:hypothetical protein
MKAIHALLCLLVVSASAAAQVPPQMPASDMHGGHTHKLGALSTTLTIVNDGKVNTFTLADLKAMPQTHITVKDGKAKRDLVWTGPLLSEVFAACGIVLDHVTEHRLVHRYAVAYGTDGYAVVFSIPELMSTFHNGQTIVAIERDGAPLTTIGLMTARRVSNLSSIEIRTATDATP